MKQAVVVRNASKAFKLYSPHRPWTVQEAVAQGLRRQQGSEVFYALRDVSFTVSAGRMFGVIGANGSGKSTLLRLVAGVMQPDAGSVKVVGRIGGLLDLGAGFHEELTGRENVLVNGVVGGLTQREVKDRFDAIVDFSELDSFIDNPLRTYSRGMAMRLAFAIAIHLDPDILLVDEVLSVGDLAFQEKCLERVARLKLNGCAILLVSHEQQQISDLCDEALWLKHGVVQACGRATDVVEQYVAVMKEEARERRAMPRPSTLTAAAEELLAKQVRGGSQEVQITSVRLLDATGTEVAEMASGTTLRVEIDYAVAKPADALIFQVYLFRADGLVCYDLCTTLGDGLRAIEGTGSIALEVERVDLNDGTYFVDVGVYAKDWAYPYDYHSNTYPLVIHGDGSKSTLASPHRWIQPRLPVRA